MKRRVKKGPIVFLILLLVLLIGGYFIYKEIQYRNSNTYKLLELGYTKEEVPILEKNFQNIDTLLNRKKDSKIVKLVQEKYFIERNLENYLSYSKENIKEDLVDVVSLVNVGAHVDEYENAKEADISKKELMLVNKYHNLKEDFKPDKINTINLQYSYANNFITEDIYEIYKQMCDDAKADGIKLVATSGYRSYESQKSVYDSYHKKNGQKYADDYAARPGFSEHQTGLALDIIGMGTNRSTFEASDAFKWLQKNAENYGFILRFPKGKERITKYAYEPWHYRYVGKEMAKKINKEGITFDEYYAFYLDKK